MYPGGDDTGLCRAGGGIQQREAGIELDAAAGCLPQLLQCPSPVARLAEYRRVQHRCLVGADDQGLRIARRHGLRFHEARQSVVQFLSSLFERKLVMLRVPNGLLEDSETRKGAGG